jgi:flagellar capping protein FliD
MKNLYKKIDTLSDTVSKLAGIVNKGFKSVKKQNTENLESLARSVNKGFGDAEKRVNEKFDAVDKRFDTVNQRFDNLESSITRRFVESNDQLHGLQDKMARVETILKIG